MSAIVAVFNRNGEPVDSDVLASMAAARSCRAVDGQDCWIRTSVGLLHQHFWVTPEESGERQPIADPLAEVALAADVRLDNRTELARMLDLDRPGEYSDSELILQAYLKWDAGCVAHLRGDFAFVLWDERQRRLFAAVDVLAARSLVYHLSARLAVFASEAVQVLAHPDVQLVVNDGRVAEYLVNCWDNLEETFFQNIFYLPPGHCMTVAAESVHKRRYTEIAVGTRIRYRDEREYVEHYIHLLRECVHSRLRCAGPVAVSMSGGLDSTAVAALAACQLGARSTGQRILASYSYAFDEFPTCDERKYIEPVVEQHKLDAHYVPCDERWTFADWEEWPFDREFILSDPFTLLPLAVIEAASQDRCRLLLGGYFGDVLFSGGNYWLLGLVREFRLLQLGAIVRESAGEIRWRRSLGDFGLRRLMPVRWRRTFRTVMPRKLQMAHPGIHDDLVRRTDLHNRTASYGWWERLNRDEDSQRFHSLMLCVFSQGAAATRWMYNQYGIELETPYWDRRLIEFAMALPADQLGRPGWDRWLHRRAMKGILPESVSKRREKTSFESLLRKGISEREHQLRELLQKPAVVERRYIQADWLREQLESPDRQAYFTVNFWTCVCLEGWLSRVE